MYEGDKGVQAVSVKEEILAELKDIRDSLIELCVGSEYKRGVDETVERIEKNLLATSPTGRRVRMMSLSGISKPT